MRSGWIGRSAVVALCSTAMAQGVPVAHWVYFHDKGVDEADAAAALFHLAESATPDQVRRRGLRRTDPGLFDVRDLTVCGSYIDAVRGTGAMPRVESRWLNAVSVLATEAQVRAIAALPMVARVEPVRTGRRTACVDLTPEAAPPYAPRVEYGRSRDQILQMNLIAMHERGYTGRGVLVGVLDTGFSRVHNVFNNPAHPLLVRGERDFINADLNTAIEPGDPEGQHSHGTLILGCMGSYLPGEMVGGCYDAEFLLCKTENVASETPVEEDYYAAAIEWCEAMGCDLTTSSLGYIDWYTQADLDGATAVTTIALNIAAANGMHACTAAGNEGHDDDPATSHLIAPADAPRVLTCGSVNLAGVASSFTSDGPTADGRVKPELLARGRNTVTVHPDTPDTFVAASGTSLSTPLLASAVACLVQANPTWTVDEMREHLFATAGDAAVNGTHDPLFIRGYGIVNAMAAHERGCAADFNRDGGVDGGDVEAFFLVWEAGEPGADVNRDGGVDGGDVEAFFIVWSAGGCG